MVPVEAHLALNHVPLVGLVFGLVFFVVGLKRSSQAALLAGLRIFVAMGIVVLLVAGSGLVTAHLLADAAWLDRDGVSVHQQVGILALVVLVSLGGFSAVMLFASRTPRILPAWAMTTVLVLAIAGLGASMWAAYLGGALRHTELGRVHPVSTSRLMRQISMRDENATLQRARRDDIRVSSILRHQSPEWIMRDGTRSAGPSAL
jgi:hypothetical protein